MLQHPALFEPITDVRDVLESFLRNQILLNEWDETLLHASERFAELGEQGIDSELTALAQRVADLAQDDLSHQEQLARSVATEVERILGELRMPGLARPDDQDWAF